MGSKMQDRIWLLRIALISAIVGIAVYIHGRLDSTVIRRFAGISYGHVESLWGSQWLGIPTAQNPNDAWIIQEIISEVTPDYIVEAGTARGGSAVLWATILRHVNPDGKVITIDIEDSSAEAKKLDISQRMITFMLGSSTNPKIVAEISERVKGKKTLVILDSDHHKEHVLNEMKSYGPLVNVGGYLIVQDSNINGHPVYPTFGPGPMEAIDAFLASNSDFQPDAGREHFLYLTNPRGYLKRIKSQ
jgi:cephalosporin hydroxylase